MSQAPANTTKKNNRPAKKYVKVSPDSPASNSSDSTEAKPAKTTTTAAPTPTTTTTTSSSSTSTNNNPSTAASQSAKKKKHHNKRKKNASNKKETTTNETSTLAAATPTPKAMDAEKTNVIANRALEEIPNLSSIQKAVLQKWYKQKVFFKIDDMKRWISEAPLSNGATDLLNWANEHPYLKVARTRVPQGIITTSGADEEVYHEIIDITVRPPTVKSRGHGRILDDDIYDLFPRVRQFVPRGLCLFASIASSTSEIKECQVVIFGMKKFTGGPGDDDDMEEEESEQVDNRPRYEHYFTEAFNQCVELIDTSKENGEASHLGQVRLGDQLYYVMGS